MKRPLFLLFFAFAIAASASDFKSGYLCYNILSEKDSTCEVTYNGKDYYHDPYTVDSVVVPMYVKTDKGTYRVVRIGNYAFNDATIRSITLPYSLKEIGEWAFCSCLALPEVMIPEGTVTISDNAFYGCAGLQEVVIPQSVTSIGVSAFQGCSMLETVKIPLLSKMVCLVIALL